MPSRRELLEAYAWPESDQPQVRMNFVQSIDGAVTLQGRSGTLGGETDRAVMQVLRTMADVVLVGAGTARAEGYGRVRVGVEDSAWREDHGFATQPRLAVVSGSLDLAPEDEVFADAAERPLVITRSAAAPGRRDALEPVADVLVCGRESVDLHAMLAAFGQRGMTRVLCEGGPHLFGALLKAELVDEVCLTVAPRLVGGGAGRILQGAPEQDRRFALAGVLSDDEGFLFLRYRRQ